jgi:hypothetical protein
MESVQHLVDALRGVFADIDASTEDLARLIDGNELGIVALTGKNDAVGNFAKHGFIEQVVIRAIEGEARNAIFNSKFYEFEFFGLATYCSSCELLCDRRLRHTAAS